MPIIFFRYGTRRFQKYWDLFFYINDIIVSIIVARLQNFVIRILLYAIFAIFIKMEIK